jgi:hypothetical protein
MPVRWSPLWLLALLLAVAGAVAWMVWPGAAPIVGPPPPTLAMPSPSVAPAAAPAPDDLVPSGTVARQPADTSAPRTAADIATNQPQGLRGLCVDAKGLPIAGVEVHLVESAGNDPVALPRLQAFAFGPLATTASRADGTFAIGLATAVPRVYELYLVSPQHALTRLGGLRLLPQEWHDLGSIVLQVGATVRGRVTVAGRADLPIAGASVTLTFGAAFTDAAVRGLREAGPGFRTTTDPDGRYELTHAPGRGRIALSAAAAGFARVSKPEVELDPLRPIDVDFSLPPGLSIGGSVRSADGAPLADARVEAWPMAAAGDPLVGSSDTGGLFAVHGLVAGPYRLRASARGFERLEVAEVAAGRSDLVLTLVAQQRLRVTVQAPNGEVLRRYRLQLRRVFPGVPNQIGAVPEVPEQHVRLDGLTDSVEVNEIPAGVFAVEVLADGFAKTLSAEFDTRGGPAGGRLDVAVTMAPGATLRGQVVDETGAPLAGAVVATMVEGLAADHPLFQMLVAVPTRITLASTKTAADGAFALPNLAPGAYQLQIEHPEACRTMVPGIRLGADALTLPPTVLPIGAAIRGRATVAGTAKGQIKVVLTTPAAARGAAESLRIETIAAADGRFLLPRRVPVGSYELRATVVGAAAPEEQFFQQLLQLQQSATTLTVLPGQRLVEHDIDLPER